MDGDPRLFEVPAIELESADDVWVHMHLHIFGNARRSELTWTVQHGDLGHNMSSRHRADFDAVQQPEKWAWEAVHALRAGMDHLSPFTAAPQAPVDLQGDAAHEAATEFEPDLETISDHG